MIAIIASIIAIILSQAFPVGAATIAAPTFLISILILGMPHGVIDPILLFSKQKSSRWLSSDGNIIWILIYLTIAFIYAIIWHFYPAPSLVFFLILTAFHWGTSEYQQKEIPPVVWWTLGLSRGLIIVLGVFTFQTNGSYELIDAITGSNTPRLAKTTLEILLTGVAIVHFTSLAFVYKTSKKTMLIKMGDSALILCLLAFTPALLGMAVYYMFFHGERYYQFFETDYKKLIIQSHLICFLAILVVALLYLNVDAIKFPTASALPIYFMVLAALTLPHSLLVMRVQNQLSTNP
ncbi:MAG: Brp/Blh family beta-carotene 15,15'-dioxygenase [Akkermansiaceae bacterium]